MFLPEQIDDKPFRLFVQRTWHLMQKNLTLSPVEKKLCFLIEEHPEVGLHLQRESMNVARQYNETDVNPFLLLGALWEVQKQLEHDFPKGLKKIIRETIPKDTNEATVRSCLAKIYIDLYQNEKSGLQTYNEEKYLYEIRERLNDPQYFGKRTEEDQSVTEDHNKGKFNYFSHIYGFESAYASTSASLYEEASSKSLSPKASLQNAFSKLPSEWLQAIASFWQRPAVKLKRDINADLCQFLMGPESADRIQAVIDEQEKQVLVTLIRNDGFIQYSRLIKKYGSESGDHFWWSQKPPQSVIGKLRLKGLIFIGMTTSNSRQYKIALIPRDFLPVIERAVLGIS